MSAWGWYPSWHPGNSTSVIPCRWVTQDPSPKFCETQFPCLWNENNDRYLPPRLVGRNRGSWESGFSMSLHLQPRNHFIYLKPARSYVCQPPFPARLQLPGFFTKVL
jgi:hypothetical protein